MTEVYVIAGLGILALIGITIKGQLEDKKLLKLEEQKKADQVQLNNLKQEESSLPNQVAKQQASATEEQKDEFWQKHLNKPTDN